MKFHGRLLVTTGAERALTMSQQTAAEFFHRHADGDWGLVCEEDKMENDKALANGWQVMSVFLTAAGTELWVVTEAANADGSRETTTVLLPEEY